jgi:autotransporter-associated beta strand protein
MVAQRVLVGVGRFLLDWQPLLSGGSKMHQAVRVSKRRRRSKLIVTAALGVALMPVAASAGTPLYWDTNGTTAGSGAATGVWGTDNSWNTDPTGGSGGSFTTATNNTNDLFFSAGTSGAAGTVTVSTTQSANSITFQNNVAITVSGGTGITLGGSTGAGIFVSSGDNAVNTISTNITLDSATNAFTFSSASTTGNLIISGNVTGSATSGTQLITLSTAAAGGIDVGSTSTIISDGAGGGKVGLLIANTGTGIVTLKNTAANTFTGGVQIRSGTLFSNNGNAVSIPSANTVTLGDTAANSLAARWQMGGTTATYANPIVLNSGTTGLLSIGSQNSSTALTITGGITGNNNFAVTNSGGAASVTIATGAVNNIGTFSNLGTGSNPTIVSANITSNVTNVVQNSATSSLTLSGTNAYTGTTTLTAGLLDFQVTAALPGYSTNPAAALGNITFTSGTLGLGYGTAAGFTAAEVGSVFAGTSPVTLPASASIGLDTTVGSGTYSGNLANPSGKVLGLTKLGTNTLTLSGTNTYTGTTLISGGVLRATDGTSLPSNSVLTISGGVFETDVNFARAGGSAAGQVQFTGSLTGGFSNSSSSAIQVAIGSLATPTNLTWASAPFAVGTFVLNESTAGGPITFLNAIALGTSARTINVNAAAANTATISGTISGSSGGTLTKAGAGTLILTGNNTYTGTLISGGTLRAASTNALGAAAGSLTFSGSSTLDLATDTSAGSHNVVVNTGITGTIVANRATSGAGITHTLGTLTLNPTGGNAALVVNLGGNVTSGTEALVFGAVTSAATTASRTTTFTPNSVNLTFASLSSTQAATFTNTMALAGTSSTNVITGGITGGGGAGTAGTLVTKSGTSTWLLGGTSTYTGATTVNAGTLGLQSGGSLGATAVAVNAGTFAVLPATNAATNALAGALTLNAGSAFTMADGATSTFNVTGASTLAPATGTAPVLTFDLGGGTSSDTLAITGAATVGAATAVINLNGVGATAAAGPYTIISAASGLNTNFTLGTTRVVINGIAYTPSLSTSTATAEIVTLTNNGAANAYFTANADATTLNATSGGTTNWSTDAAGTTDAGVQPSSGTDVFFTATSRTTSVAVTALGQSYTWNSLNFTSGAPSVSISDNAANGITITPVGVTNAINDLSANNATVNVPVTLGAAQTWSNTGSGTLTVGGATASVSNGAFLLTLAGTGPITITNFTGGSGGLTVSSGSSVTLSGTTVLAANQTWTNNGATAFSAGAINTGSFTLTLAGAGGTSLTGVISGTGGIFKSGAGTATMSAGNTYSGTTVIDQGTVVLSAAQALNGTLQFGSTAAGTNTGTLTLNGVNAAFGGLTQLGNNATGSTINVPSGQTLTINGDIVLGNATTSATTKLTITGGGGMVVNSTNVLQVGAATTGVGQTSTLDLTGLSSLTVNMGTTGTVRVNQPNATNNAANISTLNLPTPAVAAGTAVTTITAANLNVGDNNGNNAGANQVNTLRLGTGLTTLNVNTVNLGTGNRDWGQLIFAAGNGTVILRAADGVGRANVNVATGGANTGTAMGTGVNGTIFDVTAHSADLLIGTLNVGNQTRITANANYAFSFDTGTLNATTVTVGYDTASAATATANTLTSTLTIGGGTATIGAGAVTMGNVTDTNTGTATKTISGNFNVTGGTLTIGTNGTYSIRMGNNTGGTNTIVSDSFSISGGSVTLAGPIVSATQGTRTTANLSITGGTLNMSGQNIGGATSATNLTAITFSGGTLRNAGTVFLPLTQSGSTSILDVLNNNTNVGGAYTQNGGTASVAAGQTLNVTAGNATLAGTYQVATTDTTAGLLAVTSGNLNLSSGTDTLDVRPFANSAAALVIASYSGTRTGFFDNASLNGVSEGAPVISSPNTGQTLYTYNDFAVLYDDNAKNVQLTVTNAPEPATIGLAALAGFGLLARRRQRA